MDKKKSATEARGLEEINELLSSKIPLTDEAMAEVSGGGGWDYYRFDVGEIVYNGRNDRRDFKAPILDRRPTRDGSLMIYEADFVGRAGDRLGRGWFTGESFVRESDYPRPW